MADDRISRIINGVEVALGNGSTDNLGLRRLVEVIREHRWEVAIFGGFLRDLDLSGPKAIPRDVDLVVSGPKMEELVGALESSGYGVTVNTYGGLKVSGTVAPFDIWPVEVTWAFRQGFFSASLENLANTTFLNVDGIVAILTAQAVRIVQCGYSQGMDCALLRLNLEAHPRPAAAIAKTFALAAKLGFSLDEGLAKYIFCHDYIQPEEIMLEHLRHYPRPLYRWEQVAAWTEYLGTAKPVAGAIKLPDLTGEGLIS